MIEIDNIYNMDCLEGMKMIADNSVDCIICDLPYGTTANKWDCAIPLDKLWEQYKRILKPNRSVVLFAQTPFDKVLGCSNLEWLKYEWIWEKEMGTGMFNAPRAPMKCHENILVFSDGVASYTPNEENNYLYNPQMTKGEPYACRRGKATSNYRMRSDDLHYTVNEGTRYPKDILRFNRDKGGLHPTQKPLDLLRYLVLTYSNEGDLILDNCMGSGTTAIACIKEHRHFIGFELNEEYYDKACKRIKREQQQLTLF